ncbi:hypothetical protein [Methylobacillus glycogenes]|uniref:hypothetical protein n=1 Tax=Methylobacillus glycogenes TaxID=406 RepID=UPI0009DD0CE3|nr:hypothetical protein [Methylobacillus glycogenes]
MNTFNSAGFSKDDKSDIEEAFSIISKLIGTQKGLSSFADKDNYNNFYAENGINFTTNNWEFMGFDQHGHRVPLFQEASDPISTFENHSMYKITDYLALGSMLEKLDINLDFTKLNSLIKTASNNMDNSYETVLDVLREIILGSSVVSTPSGKDNDTVRLGPWWCGWLWRWWLWFR